MPANSKQEQLSFKVLERVTLKLGRSTVTAVGEPVHLVDRSLWPEHDIVFRHVLRARILRPWWHAPAAAVLQHWLVPAAAQRAARRLWPALWLPEQVVIKKLKSAEWEDEFNKETRLYAALEPLQGRRVPVFYGEAAVVRDVWDQAFGRATRALVLSEVHGYLVGLLHVRRPPEPLDWDEIRRRLSEAIHEMFDCARVICEEGNPYNMFLAADDGRIVFVDLEGAAQYPPDVFEDGPPEYLIDHLMPFGKPRPPQPSSPIVYKPPPQPVLDPVRKAAIAALPLPDESLTGDELEDDIERWYDEVHKIMGDDYDAYVSGYLR
ncbi:hypothetical protein RB595_003984 [Gaeumannomyces hyphopodioides]